MLEAFIWPYLMSIDHFFEWLLGLHFKCIAWGLCGGLFFALVVYLPKAGKLIAYKAEMSRKYSAWQNRIKTKPEQKNKEWSNW